MSTGRALPPGNAAAAARTWQWQHFVRVERERNVGQRHCLADRDAHCTTTRQPRQQSSTRRAHAGRSAASGPPCTSLKTTCLGAGRNWYSPPYSRPMTVRGPSPCSMRRCCRCRASSILRSARHASEARARGCQHWNQDGFERGPAGWVAPSNLEGFRRVMAGRATASRACSCGSSGGPPRSSSSESSAAEPAG